MNYNNSKVTKVVYNIIEKKIPSKTETYKDILEEIEIETIDSGIPTNIITKLEKLYTHPKNVKQILFLFIGSLDQYENLTHAILNDFSQYIISNKNFTKYKNLKILKKAFGNDFNIKLNITATDNSYLYSKIYFITKHISKVNTISDVENIICSFINQSIRTNVQIKKRDKNLEVNKTLIYSDCYLDDIIIKNIQSNIMLSLQKHNYNFIEFLGLLETYYVHKIIIKKIKKILY